MRYDETRLFLVALTRAGDRVVVTAVRSDDEQPSVYLDVIDPLPDAEGRVTRPFTEVPRTITLATLVAQVRRRVVGTDDGVPDRAAPALARLAREHVPGADPSHWWTMRELTDDPPAAGGGCRGARLPLEGRGLRSRAAPLAPHLLRW